MAGSLNKVMIIGTLGKDPEIRTFNNGGRVANLSVATSESWKDKATGEKKTRTEWHRVNIMNDALVGVAERFLRKGSRVYIEGQLETRSWDDAATGTKKYATEITLRPYNGTLTMLGEPKNASAQADDGEPEKGIPPTTTQAAQNNSMDDEIPF